MTLASIKALCCRALATGLILLVAACAHRPPAAEPAPSVGLFTGVPANPFGKVVFLSQRITGTFGKDKKSLQFEVEIRPDRLVMVATSQSGLPLFTILYDGTTGHIQTHVPLGGSIDPNWILNDFLLSYWPEATLKAHLAGSGLRLENMGTTRRIVSQDGQPVVTVHYLASPQLGTNLDLQNARYGYVLHVRTYHVEEDGGAS